MSNTAGMPKQYVNWTELEIKYLRRYAPKSGDKARPDIWCGLSQGLNIAIKEWCKNHPKKLIIDGKVEKLIVREPWERTAIAVEDYYIHDGYSKVHPEAGPAAKPENLVDVVPRYTKETESSIYPLELDLKIKSMIEGRVGEIDWDNILRTCRELGDSEYPYVYRCVWYRYKKHLKDVNVEKLEERAKNFMKPQNVSDRLAPQPSGEGSSSTKQEVGRPLHTTEPRDSDTRISKGTDRRDQSNKAESSKNRQGLPVPRSSAGSSSSSRREEIRPVRATELQGEVSKKSGVVAERVDIERDRQHHKTNQPLAPSGGSGNYQQRPAAKTGAQYTRQGSQRNREENLVPQKASVKRENPSNKYRDRVAPVLGEPEDGEIVEIKRTDTERSNSPDKQGARDSRREKNAEIRRKQERQNVFGRRS
ncbi:hypothetical protein BHYA_0042g00040 [Botrytis hyacinthi]|uniref:Uncharacterized protein n=1 Tax=Botrytis hyacinthi TaxID=278943 RepID=A0A4Z1H484_9HELO|nr:hypothetical protein BHYA_0042g00040 [Botrytis hyacinthi]